MDFLNIFTDAASKQNKFSWAVFSPKDKIIHGDFCGNVAKNSFHAELIAIINALDYICQRGKNSYYTIYTDCLSIVENQEKILYGKALGLIVNIIKQIKRIFKALIRGKITEFKIFKNKPVINGTWRTQ